MGSGICSAATVRNALGLKTKLVGVVSDQAPTYALSLEQKKIVEAPATTKLADGLACRLGDEEALEIMLENVDHIVRVTDDEVAAAMRAMFTDTHNVVEGAGAASLWPPPQKNRHTLKGKRVALIATGGNVDQDVFAQVLSESSTAAQVG